MAVLPGWGLRLLVWLGRLTPQPAVPPPLLDRVRVTQRAVLPANTIQISLKSIYKNTIHEVKISL